MNLEAAERKDRVRGKSCRSIPLLTVCGPIHRNQQRKPLCWSVCRAKATGPDTSAST
jgi:hypothetical protein